MAGRRSPRPAGVTLLVVIVALLATIGPVAPVAAVGPGPQIPVIAPGSAYRQRNLVSDVPGMALLLDPLLVSPWGVAVASTGRFMVAADGTSTGDYFRGDVAGSPLIAQEVLTIPGGLPTGALVNPSATDWVISAGSVSGPARLLFSSITGNIIGWNPGVPAAGSTTGRIGASQPGHVYTGLAFGNNGANLLYAPDFASGVVDVYDASFASTTVTGGFVDATIPAGYAPFNVQSIGASVYVSYAEVGVDGLPVSGGGKGYLRRFNTDGIRDLTFGVNGGALNAPWGMTIAPPSFGIFGGALLVGNYGRGTASISAYNPTTGAFLGRLQNEGGEDIVIDRLFALAFGNDDRAGDADTLYFTAGTGDREHGLLGSLTPTTSTATSTLQFSTDEYSIGEASPSIQVSVTRNGDASGWATVRYATWDQSQPGHASQKSDYELNAGILIFAPGETSKKFEVHVVNDRFVEGDETIDLALSNPAGGGVGLGAPTAATLTIIDNDSGVTPGNPVDETAFFVRQHFIDFLEREPSASSMTYWSNQINSCGANATCRKARRNSVASRFLQAPEFVNSIGWIYRLRRAAFKSDPLYGEVQLDAHVLRMRGQSALLGSILDDPRFVTTYTGLSNSNYVKKLAANSGFAFSTAKKNAWIAALNRGSMTRATVLAALARDAGYQAFVRNRFNVLAGFWAWDRRDPDISTFNQRLNQLNAGGGNPLTSGMVNAFVYGMEYRQRFGPS